MESQELFFPVGWIELTQEQSSKVKAALGKDITWVPVFRVVALSPMDRFLPVMGVPGVQGVVIHYGERPKDQSEKDRHGEDLVASILDEMASQPGAPGFFTAHSKLMAPRQEPPPRPREDRPGAPAKAT